MTQDAEQDLAPQLGHVYFALTSRSHESQGIKEARCNDELLVPCFFLDLLSSSIYSLSSRSVPSPEESLDKSSLK